MKRNIIIFTLLLQHFASIAQSVVGNVPGKGMDIQSGPGGFVSQLPPAPSEPKGDVYMNSDWSVADLTLYNDTELKDLRVRLDLSKNEFEINHDGKVKVLEGTRVKNFSLLSAQTGKRETFQNAKTFKVDGVPIIGFLRAVDATDQMQLVGKTDLKLIQAAYVAALDAGTKKDKLVKRETYFFAKNSNLYEVLPNANKFSAQFGENSDEVKEFIKSNKLSLKNEDHLRALLGFLSKQAI